MSKRRDEEWRMINEGIYPDLSANADISPHRVDVEIFGQSTIYWNDGKMYVVTRLNDIVGVHSRGATVYDMHFVWAVCTDCDKYEQEFVRLLGTS
jgi:hypothetical protein